MELLHRIFYTALGAASLFYFVVKVSLSYWRNRGILHDKPAFLWGNLKGVGKKKHIATAIQEVYDKYKGRAEFIGFYAYLKPMVLVLDINVTGHILSDDIEYFEERGLYNNRSDDPLSGNLLQLDGEIWREVRKKLKPIFATENMSFLLPTMVKVAATFKSSFALKLSDQDVFNINELVSCYNMDICSMLAFGIEGDTLQYPNTEFRVMANGYFNNFSPLREYLAWNYPNLARLLKHRSYSQVATNYFVSIVKQKLQEYEWNCAQEPTNFLHLLSQLKGNGGKSNRLNEKEIAAQVFSFILIGMQACNSTLGFCLYELALKPEIQDKARLEIVSVMQKNNDKLNLNSLKDMQYLKQILYETLRKHCPYPLLLRNTVKDYEIPDSVFMLKEGNQAILPVYSIHHDQDIYPNPGRFDPNRFQPDVMKKRHPMAWLPFGSGPRNCISQQFAELQMLVGLVSLLKDYKFSPCSETCVPMHYDNTKLVLLPECDIKLRVEHVI